MWILVQLVEKQIARESELKLVPKVKNGSATVIEMVRVYNTYRDDLALAKAVKSLKDQVPMPKDPFKPELYQRFPLQGLRWFDKLGSFYLDDLQKLVDHCVSLLGVGLTTIMLLIRAQECNLTYLLEYQRLGTLLTSTILDSHYMRVKNPESKLKAPGAASPQKPKSFIIKQGSSQESANSGAGANAILSQAFEEKGIME